MVFVSTTLLILLWLSPLTLGASYALSDKFAGSSFFKAFSFETVDYNHGRVNYVDRSTAINLNLTTSTSKSFVIRADDITVLSPNGPGRNSVKLKSYKQYSTHVAVFNMRHMPEGCGTWPAIWEAGNTWPGQGEVDIVEGINNQEPNLASLHTSPGCTMPNNRVETGTPTANDCNVYANNNQGCGVRFTGAAPPFSFGPSFNNHGGGWYAMERNPSYFKIWFWPRGDPTVPAEVASGAATINTDNWGIPVAYFPNTSCDLSSKFGPNNLMINLNFCGDWAGNAYGGSGCPSTCVDYVNNNPSAFTNAYFDFVWINVYA